MQEPFFLFASGHKFLELLLQLLEPLGASVAFGEFKNRKQINSTNSAFFVIGVGKPLVCLMARRNWPQFTPNAIRYDITIFDRVASDDHNYVSKVKTHTKTENFADGLLCAVQDS